MMWFFIQTAQAAERLATDPKVVAKAKGMAHALTGSEVAMWVIGAGSILLGAYKLIEWLMATAGISKSPQEKLLAALSDDLALIRSLHSILTDKQREARLESLDIIKGHMDRVFPWFKVPPEVETPPFWCKSGAQAAELRRIGAALDELIKTEGERDKQTDLIIKLLQALTTMRRE